MEEKFLLQTEGLIELIRKSPTAFQAVETAETLLAEQNFHRLEEGAPWTLSHGENYYFSRNGSAILAFKTPKKEIRRILITATHTDSPTFKLKPVAESEAQGAYQRLNTEPYGGAIYSSWMDIPLSIAGRAVVEEGNRVVTRNLTIDRDLCLIPNVAIHQNRTVNSGNALNAAVDLIPLIGENPSRGKLGSLIAEALSCREEQILATDLYLYNRTPGTIWGLDREFFSSPRIDNLMCFFGSLEGLMNAGIDDHTLAVCYGADNEETGNATKQGAGSVLLSDTLDRICECFGGDRRELLASSFMVSADNAHAIHPNHPEYFDVSNSPRMNRGIVVKSNASQKYATDAFSKAVFEKLCREADVPVQHFANRSDLPGGSTLGSISNTLVPLNTVDVGMAQLAMHSAYETAGTRDYAYLTRATRHFFESTVYFLSDGVCEWKPL